MKSKLILSLLILGIFYQPISTYAEVLTKEDPPVEEQSRFYEPHKLKPRPEDHLKDVENRKKQEEIKKKLIIDSHTHLGLAEPNKLDVAKKELDSVPTNALKMFSDLGGQIKFTTNDWDTIGIEKGKINNWKDIEGKDISGKKSDVTASIKVENYSPTLYIDISRQQDYLTLKSHLDLQYRLGKVITEGLIGPDVSLLKQFFNTIRSTDNLSRPNVRLEGMLFAGLPSFSKHSGIFTEEFLNKNSEEAKDIFSRAVAYYMSPNYEGALKLYSTNGNSTYEFVNQLLDKEVFQKEVSDKLIPSYTYGPGGADAHLIQGETPAVRADGVFGTHNAENFIKSIRTDLRDPQDILQYNSVMLNGDYVVSDDQIKKDLNIKSSKVGLPTGLEEYSYQLPKYEAGVTGNMVTQVHPTLPGELIPVLKPGPFKKTVYDPKVYSDKDMVTLGHIALSGPNVVKEYSNKQTKYYGKVGQGDQAMYFEAYSADTWDINTDGRISSYYPIKKPTTITIPDSW